MTATATTAGTSARDQITLRLERGATSARKGKAQIKADQEAAGLIADLYLALQKSSPALSESDLAFFVTRLMFAMWAEDTKGIVMDEMVFTDYVTRQEKIYARGLGGAIGEFFQFLNETKAQRSGHSDEWVRTLPYVNGRLFAGTHPAPHFDAAVRTTLRSAMYYDWSKIDPTLVGSIFQNITNEDKRRTLGEHYTSKETIRFAIDPLMKPYWQTVEDALDDAAELHRAHTELTKVTLFDPACGSGNFLMIGYEDLRDLEMVVLQGYRDLYSSLGHAAFDAQLTAGMRKGILRAADRDRIMAVATEQTSVAGNLITRIRPSQLVGIEIDELPAQIAETFFWIMKLQKDIELSNLIYGGRADVELPLRDPIRIVHGDAADLEWDTVLPSAMTKQNLLVVGNPPFNGTRKMTPTQKDQVIAVWGRGNLDFASIWYRKAAELVRGTSGKVSLVSTSSVFQGEQAPIMWPTLRAMGVDMLFAHQPFAWRNEARVQAGVHTVITAFTGKATDAKKTLWTYAKPTSKTPTPISVSRINGYLADGPDLIVKPATKAISPSLSKVRTGTDFKDGARGEELGAANAALIMDEDGYREAMDDPIAAKYVRPLTGTAELINGQERWCLWLVDAEPSDLRTSPIIRRRVANVKKARSAMASAATKAYAATPALAVSKFPPKHFGSDRYLVVPGVNSVRREYLPCGFVPSDTITTHLANAVYEATLLDFAVASSEHMMLWAKAVAGKMKSDPRFGARTAWNTFPLPTLSAADRADIERAGQRILEVRAAHTGQTLADLYDPDDMPADLRDAHEDLDILLDRVFGVIGSDRLSPLFESYDRLT